MPSRFLREAGRAGSQTRPVVAAPPPRPRPGPRPPAPPGRCAAGRRAAGRCLRPLPVPPAQVRLSSCGGAGIQGCLYAGDSRSSLGVRFKEKSRLEDSSLFSFPFAPGRKVQGFFSFLFFCKAQSTEGAGAAGESLVFLLLAALSRTRPRVGVRRECAAKSCVIQTQLLQRTAGSSGDAFRAPTSGFWKARSELSWRIALRTVGELINACNIIEARGFNAPFSEIPGTRPSRPASQSVCGVGGFVTISNRAPPPLLME